MCPTNCAAWLEEYPARAKLRSLLWRTFLISTAAELISVQWHLTGLLTLNHLQIFCFLSSSCSSFTFFLSQIRGFQLSASHSDASQEKAILEQLPCPPSSAEASEFKGRTRGRFMGKAEAVPSPSSHKAPFPYSGTRVLECDVSCTPSCS